MIRSFRMFGGVMLILSVLLLAGCSSQPQAVRMDTPSAVKLDGVQAGQFDTGKMWTFDFPPTEYFAQTYSFNPTKDWFEKARLSSLRLPGCTAAFVSEDGLVMTNHHCVRGSLDRINKEGEKLGKDGFYATTLPDERKVPGLYIDQLIVTQDVTGDVQAAFNSGKTEAEKIANRAAKITEIQAAHVAKFKETSKDSMVFQVVTFYNGGRYSLYGYKRYTDVRMVYAPETDVAFYGGDPDNFTYPRYDFDVSFYRVYENDQPVKTSNFYKFSKAGAKEGEAVFVIGNPGTTDRLLTVAQLEFNRDLSWPMTISMLKNMMGVYQNHVEKHPDQQLKYQNMIFGISNSLKAFSGYLGGLENPVYMAKKRDFEKKFRDAVLSKPDLKAKYGDVWKEIALYQDELSKLFPKTAGYGAAMRRGGSTYLGVASTLVDYAKAAKGPADKLPRQYRPENLEMMKGRMYPPDLNTEIEEKMMAMQLEMSAKAFAGSNAAMNKLLGGKTVDQTAASLVATSIVASKEKALELFSAGPDAILASTDPLIAYYASIFDEAQVLRAKAQELNEKQAAKVQLLGNAMYDVYGTKIPPDATFTLRIADGVVKGYDYNGTIAPPHTTFYGMYDRYYSHRKPDWTLPERWLNPPPTFDMSTPMNFVSTNDIIGGNSGSSVINRDLEVVGLIFDGNIESLPGRVIYDEVVNRSVSVHSAGILEGLEDIYKAERIVKELRAGKME